MSDEEDSLSAARATGTRRELSSAANAPSNVADGQDLTRSASSSMAAPQGGCSGARSQLSVTATLRDPDRYQIINEHGRGGLGRVSRAHDLELGRDVAIKELLSRGSTGEARFVREALITARLEHPGIVPVHEAGRWPDGTPFYAMKLVAGRPLRDLIAERDNVQDRLGLLHHVIAVADAIAYAHGRNIIHRDLKPANVIVGDFGETVVIDWGLAKDLSSSKAVADSDELARDRYDVNLTAAGCVVGTPTYMAPEQERGEAVDQRADVFAIGAMLWELCSLQKVPPSDLRLRHRMLRRAGIDQDFVTIIDKSLDPQPARRYPDAGALAADLKAFKAGTRIAARTYSLLGLLKHWSRRHRTLAVSAALLAFLISVGAPLYFTSINRERSRADAALAVATQANSSLAIAHAELLIDSDPTSALDVLKEYNGIDSARRSELFAEARGRGVAQLVARPHNDTIWFMKGLKDGSFVSIAEDHRIQHTSLSGTTTTVASDVSSTVLFAYAAKPHVIAYSMSPNGVGLVELATFRRRTIPASDISRIAFSATGAELVIQTKDTVALWDVSGKPAKKYERPANDVQAIAIDDRSDVIVATTTGVDVVAPDGALAITRRLHVTAITTMNNAIVAGLPDGSLTILSTNVNVLATAQVCTSRVAIVAIAEQSNAIAFGCAEGVVGSVRYSQHPDSLQLETSFQVPRTTWKVALSHTGSMLVAIDDRTVFCHDVTSHVTKRLEGQEARIAAVAPPDDDSEVLLTGDINGTARVWAAPSFMSRMVARVPGQAFGARFSPDGTHVAIYGADSSVRILDLVTNTMSSLLGHTGAISGVHFSQDGTHLMSFSRDGISNCWRISDGRLLRTFKEHHAVVEDGDFIDDGRRVVSVGGDGRLFAWSPDADETQLLLTIGHPFVALEVVRSTNEVVTHDGSGNLWTTTFDGVTRHVRQGTGTAITVMRASPRGDRLAIGEETGGIVIFDTKNWAVSNRLRVDGPVARIEFDPGSSSVLATVDNRFVYLFSLDFRNRSDWKRIPVAAHDVSYSEDGAMVAIGALDGGVWFYLFKHARWVYAREHATEVWSAQFSPDGSTLVSADRSGVVNVWPIDKLLPD